MPFWVECLYVKDSYVLKRHNAVVSAMLYILPAFFAYTMSNRSLTDKRVIKFFLPNGMMRNYLLKTYGKQIKTGGSSSLSKFFRCLLPYGYVLWWDSECSQNCVAQSNAPKVNNTPSNADITRLEKKITELQKTCLENQAMQRDTVERIEIELLKLAIAMDK